MYQTMRVPRPGIFILRMRGSLKRKSSVITSDLPALLGVAFTSSAKREEKGKAVDRIDRILAPEQDQSVIEQRIERVSNWVAWFPESIEELEHGLRDGHESLPHQRDAVSEQGMEERRSVGWAG